jgi:hypothetical protein
LFDSRLSAQKRQQAAAVQNNRRKKRFEPSADSSNLLINQKLTDRLSVINLDVAISFNLNFHAAVATEVTVATIVARNSVSCWSDDRWCSVVSSKW